MNSGVFFTQGPLNGGVSNGGVSRSGLVLPFLSFFVLFGTFPIFLGLPDLLGDGPGIFPICPFPLSRPIKSTYEEQSRKGPRHNLDLSQKSGKHPGLETPRFSFSQLRKTSTMHIELLFQNGPAKSSRTDFFWFGLPGPLLNLRAAQTPARVLQSSYQGQI